MNENPGIACYRRKHCTGGAPSQPGRVGRHCPPRTVYGIAADARNGAAVRKIFEAKGRPQDNPLIVHIYGMEMLHGIVTQVPVRARKLAEAFWARPPDDGDAPRARGQRRDLRRLDTVGVRMPSHPVVQAVIQASGVAFCGPIGQSFRQAQPHQRAGHAGRYGRPPAPDPGRGRKQRGGRVYGALRGRGASHAAAPPDISQKSRWSRAGEEVLVSPAILEKTQGGEIARSPGMKYKHYAPKAQVTIVQGSFDAYPPLCAGACRGGSMGSLL